MIISEDQTRVFICAYKEEFGDELSVDQARKMLTRLVTLYDLLARPLPSGAPQQGVGDKGDIGDVLAAMPPDQFSIRSRNCFIFAVIFGRSSSSKKVRTSSRRPHKRLARRGKLTRLGAKDDLAETQISKDPEIGGECSHETIHPVASADGCLPSPRRAGQSRHTLKLSETQGFGPPYGGAE
jgi:hypothetical protein